MKKNIYFIMAIFLTMTLTMLGTGYAGWSGGDKPESETPAVEEALPEAPSSEEAMTEGEHIILSGKVNEEGRFIDETGEAFELAETDQGKEVKSLVDTRVEIKGTVMEEEGQRTLEVIEYKILE